VETRQNQAWRGAVGPTLPLVTASVTLPLIAGTVAELAQCFTQTLVQQRVASDFDPLLLAKAALLHHAVIPTIMDSGVNLAEFLGLVSPQP
jgi:hypothetical protein